MTLAASRYTNLQAWLHWLSAVLIVAMAFTGVAYSYEVIGKPALSSHQILGQVLILVFVVRVFFKFRTPRLHPLETHTRFEQVAASVLHLCLYGLLIFYLLSGYISASALSSNVLAFPADIGFARSDTGEQLLELHYLLKWVMLALLALHIGAALKHHFWDKDTTFTRITPKTNRGTP